MRVAVIGAGIVGVTTAFELAEDGHEVTVYERHGSLAAEGSFANGGSVAPGYLAAWSVPGTPGKALLQMTALHAAWRFGLATVLQTRWVWRRWRACRPQVQQVNRLRLHRLAVFSQAHLQALTARLHLDYEQQQGQLVLLRSERDLTLLRPGLEALEELREPHALLDAAGARLIEPALSPDAPLHAAIHLPGAQVANCRQFAHLLKAEAQHLGVRFRFRHEVLGITAGSPLSVRVQPRLAQDTTALASTLTPDSSDALDVGPQTFDAVVVCAAMGSPALLAPLGLKLPLAAVHGHSITAPLRLADTAMDTCPRSGVLDERYRVTISRMGNRIRVAGGAELGHARSQLDDNVLATLYKVLDDWFPAAARTAKATQWRGTRAMLPDGPPLLGPTGMPGVFMNLGHGAHGWALGCGSARVVADLVGQRQPAIDLQGLGIDRLR
ncbi:MAG: FAD-dependent oxidoreductase [Vitreoscilla sp.]|nr:FAD-dependent oxidoreductase [Vitreoscilla sp.]MBP6673692.1 FAD-dependent oxidoreductase [Vitreoscilla sp.]